MLMHSTSATMSDAAHTRQRGDGPAVASGRAAALRSVYVPTFYYDPDGHRRRLHRPRSLPPLPPLQHPATTPCGTLERYYYTINTYCYDGIHRRPMMLF